MKRSKSHNERALKLIFKIETIAARVSGAGEWTGDLARLPRCEKRCYSW